MSQTLTSVNNATSSPQMNRILSPMWDYGPWAVGFYAQLRIRVVSADGLTKGYTPHEGYSQGNPFSANGYQGTSVLASSASPSRATYTYHPGPPRALPGHFSSPQSLRSQS